MRAIWSGAISFGLVNIPVKLYSAAGEEKISFELLAKPDFSKVKYKKVAASDGRDLENDEIIKGYEFSKDKYVIMEDSDFEKVNISKSKAIDLINFVKEEEIDPVYYEKPYYLEPDKNSEKPYALLREALANSKKIGIARFVIRNKEHLGAIKTVGDILLLNQMRYYKDIRSYGELNLPKKDIASSEEVEMAENLIEQLTEHFKPEKFHDSYIEELKKVIEEKANGKVIETKGEKPEATKVDDLMATLKESLKASRSKNRPPAKKSKSSSSKNKKSS